MKRSTIVFSGTITSQLSVRQANVKNGRVSHLLFGTGLKQIMDALCPTLQTRYRSCSSKAHTWSTEWTWDLKAYKNAQVFRPLKFHTSTSAISRQTQTVRPFNIILTPVLKSGHVVALLLGCNFVRWCLDV